MFEAEDEERVLEAARNIAEYRGTVGELPGQAIVAVWPKEAQKKSLVLLVSLETVQERLAFMQRVKDDLNPSALGMISEAWTAPSSSVLDVDTGITSHVTPSENPQRGEIFMVSLFAPGVIKLWTAPIEDGKIGELEEGFDSTKGGHLVSPYSVIFGDGEVLDGA